MLSSFLSVLAVLASAPLVLSAPASSPLKSSSLARRVQPCPYTAGNLVTVRAKADTDGREEDLAITYLSAGSFGCVFNVQGQYPDPSRPSRFMKVVAKTPREGDFDQTEIDALTGIRELSWRGTSADGRQWILIKRQEGKPIFETQGWKAQFPQNYNTDTSKTGVQACKSFMLGVYMTITDKVMDSYVVPYGWSPNDINFNNFLFSDDLKTVNIIDWGHAVNEGVIQAKSPQYQEMGRTWVEELAWYSLLPVKDDKNGQGVCKSDERNVHKPWYNPFDRLASVLV